MQETTLKYIAKKEDIFKVYTGFEIRLLILQLYRQTLYANLKSLFSIQVDFDCAALLKLL